jgi:PAS domain S-box-containing protein
MCYKNVTPTISDAVIVTDSEGRITSLNNEAERLTGWKSSDVAGNPLSDVFRIVNEQTRQPAESPVERALREGVVVGLTNHTVLISKNGREIPIDDSAAPIRREGGPVLGVEGGHTELMRAALEGETETVERLLESGTSVNERDDEGRTALMFAVINIHGNTVKVCWNMEQM